jgi:hypothetical protein
MTGNLQGKIIHWDPVHQNGIVLGQDGKRFFLHVARVVQGPEIIKSGMLVDFTPTPAPTPARPGHLPLALGATVFEAPAPAATEVRS